MSVLHQLAAPGKSDSNEQHSTVETIERLEPGELNGDDASEGAVRYNQARTLILLVVSRLKCHFQLHLATRLTFE